MRRAQIAALAWLAFYALAVGAGIVANYSQEGIEVAAAMGVWP
jgi:hypothetical protein